MTDQILRFNTAQCHISKVEIANTVAGFKVYSFEKICLDDKKRSMTWFRSQHEMSVNAGIEGELHITPASNVVYAGRELVVRIFFEAAANNTAVYLDGRYFVTHTGFTGARNWFPCSDHVTLRCPFTLEVTVDSGMSVNIGQGKLSTLPVTAVCTGVLQQQVFANPQETMKTFYYIVEAPVRAREIVVAAGPFEILVDPEKRTITSFCPPGRLSDLTHCTTALGGMFEFFDKFFNTSGPFAASLKAVFVPGAYEDATAYVSTAVMSADLLHGPREIDQTLITRRHLAYSMAYSWVSGILTATTLADVWILHGMTNYVTDLYMRTIYGNNEHRHRLYQRMLDVVARERSLAANSFRGAAPLSGQFTHEEEALSALALNKAAFVFHMLDRRIGAEPLKKLIQQLVQQATNDEKVRLTTEGFIKAAHKLGGVDLTTFCSQWITSSGLPLFTTGFQIDRRRNLIHFGLQQELVGSSYATKFIGPITIRVVENEGTYDHQVVIEQESHEFQFPCHSRIKRARKPKKGEKEGEEKDDAMMGETPPPMGNPVTPTPSTVSGAAPASPVPFIPTGPPLTPGGKERPDSAVLWVTLDPDQEWIMGLQSWMPDFMWMSQLDEERDAVSQYRAVMGLKRWASTSVMTALHAAMCNKDFFYPVRAACAEALGQMAARETDWIGANFLTEFFERTWKSKERKMVAPNNFEDIGAYHVKRAVIRAIGSMKNENGIGLNDACQLLLNIVLDNDNTGNVFDDNHYMADCILALAQATSRVTEFRDRVKQQITRLLGVDQLMPSYRNSISCACLRALSMMDTLREDSSISVLLREHASAAYPRDVRIAAARALAKVSLLVGDTFSFLLSLAETDPSLSLRAQILDAMRTAAEGSMENAFFAQLRAADSEHNASLADRLWNVANVTFDQRVRLAAAALYETIWGFKTPACIITRRKRAGEEVQEDELGPASVRAMVRPGFKTTVRTGGKRHKGEQQKLTLKLKLSSAASSQQYGL
eukprot:TRINITY_DN8586_c0_g4_i1.p1 TRINITY_DN8586_c0_g4~~TRINITY_DN8586_c0_g4_i1.p1  ORF type:complete len:1042 (+),score=252.59 TRINITY_DN8586_c0_g4_i1:136-3126(+)